MATTTKRRKRLETALGAAVSHPIRSKCLVILAERVASPAEISRELGSEVTTIGYHVTALAEAGLIEEVGNRPVRGALEHFYRAVQLPIVTGEQEADLSEAERRVHAESVLSIHAANAAHALEVGTFLDRADHHLTRHALNVDEAGWSELVEAYLELYERVYAIKEAAAGRLGRSGKKPIRVVSFQSLFEVPPAT
ncbi:MAG: winged helix-turn-helix transcriptional regulator [Actinobacteria bacterium]|nr:winged helix-turn-helix transcriptional regulator [Actinomycetota bacterium]